MAQAATLTGFDLEHLKELGRSPDTVPAQHTSPQGGEEFAALRAKIDELERAKEAQAPSLPAPGQRDTASVPAAGVTATVTRRQRRGAAVVSRSKNTRRSDTPMNTDQARSPNTPTLEAILATTAELGATVGKSKDAQIKLDLCVLEAAYHGTLDLDPNKHGTDVRDGVRIGEAYVQAQQGNVIFDAKAPNQRRLVANIDKMIKLGMNPRWGQGQPLQAANDLITLRQSLRKDPANTSKLDDAHNTLMRWATQQLKSETLIDGQDLREFCFKKDPNMVAAEDVLDNVRKTLNNLRAGKIARCPEVDASNEVQEVVRLLTKRLTAIAKAKGAGTANQGAATKAA